MCPVADSRQVGLLRGIIGGPGCFGPRITQEASMRPAHRFSIGAALIVVTFLFVAPVLAAGSGQSASGKSGMNRSASSPGVKVANAPHKSHGMRRW